MSLFVVDTRCDGISISSCTERRARERAHGHSSDDARFTFTGYWRKNNPLKRVEHIRHNVSMPIERMSTKIEKYAGFTIVLFL